MLALIVIFSSEVIAQQPRIDVWFGKANMQLPINSDVYVPVTVHSTSSNVLIGSLNTPLATNDDYIVDRTQDGIINPPLTQWDEAMFGNIVPDCVYDYWTCRNLWGIADIGGPSNPWLIAGDSVTIGFFKMRTAADPSLIGQTLTVFEAGYDLIQGYTSFADDIGTSYTDIHQTFYQVTFID